MSRGIRNNNPGNIRWGCTWQGLKVDGKEQDKDFCVFISPIYGIRALAKILINYKKLYGLTTIGGIIHRFAPPSENNTVAYIKHVSKCLKKDSDEIIDVEHKETLLKLIKAIILHENGENPYTDDVIMKGIKLV